MRLSWIRLVTTVFFAGWLSGALAQQTVDGLRGAMEENDEPAETAEENAVTEQGRRPEPDLRRTVVPVSGVTTPAAGLRAPTVAQRIAAAQSGRLAPNDPQFGVFDGETRRDMAQGIRVGRFTVLPSLSAGSGWTDNAAKSATGSGDGFYSVEGGVDVRSDWARHALGGSLRGTYQSFFSEQDNNAPQLDGSVDGRLDLGEQTAVALRGDYSFSREARSSAENDVTSGQTASQQFFGGQLDVERRVGVIGAIASLGADRSVYGDAGSSSGGSRNNTVYEGTARLETQRYGEIGGFVEAGGLMRRFDDTCAPTDPSCRDRDATGYQIRGGLLIDRGPKLRGEIGIGWRQERPDDPRLDKLEGMLVDGSLIWSPTRRDTVTFGVDTGFEATSLVEASGSLLYSGTIAYTHQFSEDLVGDVDAGFSYRRYEGISLTERDFSSGLGLTWALSDFAALETRYTYEVFRSSENGRNYESSTIEAGLRLRR
ncbi:outer membrane beta-barrel protein [Pseudovibrio exalbescens]|uniref:outer membrane beta-barrel protein n=1 Tax=Pseudovibrio exalbescens TaxID=197461 RepID=UPI000C99EDEA|nr:outer membrane beta-barrel protein [Pseudovibrio exalbescens]